MLPKSWILFLVLLPSLVLAQVGVRDDVPQQYVVQPGDTLWDISATFLQSPWKWPEIWYVNPQIENPHLIYPGDIIRLVYVNGEPRLELVRGTGGVVKLSPEIRNLPPRTAIDSIPLDAVREFFSNTRVLDKEVIEAAPYVVAGPEGRIMVGAGDKLYARGEFPEDLQVYQIYRVGDPYRDPATAEIIGIRAEAMGGVRLDKRNGEVGTFTVYDSHSEIIIGDILLPLQQDQLDPVIVPAVPAYEITGEIIAVEGGVSHIGQLDVVALNIGQDWGLSPGHVLAVMQRGERVRDRVKGGYIDLPDERSGILMIFRSLERMSFGLILEAERPIAVGDQLALP
jgi:hypothetical protein